MQLAKRRKPQTPHSVPFNPTPINSIPLYRLEGDSPVRVLWDRMRTHIANRSGIVADPLPSSRGWYYVMGDNGERVYTRKFVDSGGLHNSAYMQCPDMDDINPQTGVAYRPVRTVTRDDNATTHSIRRHIGRNNGKGSDKGTLRGIQFRLPSNPNGSGIINNADKPLAEMRPTDETLLYRLATGFARRLVTKRLAMESDGFQKYATSVASADIYQSIVTMLLCNYDPTIGCDTPNKDGTQSPLYIPHSKESNKPADWIGKPIGEAFRFYAYHAMREYGRSYTPRMPGLFIKRRSDPRYVTVSDAMLGRWGKRIPVDGPTCRMGRIVTIGTNYQTHKPTLLEADRDTDTTWSVVTDRVFTFYRTLPYDPPKLTNRKDWKLRKPIKVPMGLYRTTDPARTVEAREDASSVMGRIIDGSADPAKLAERMDSTDSLNRRLADTFATLSESDMLLVRRAMRGESVTQSVPHNATDAERIAIGKNNAKIRARVSDLVAKLSKGVA